MTTVIGTHLPSLFVIRLLAGESENAKEILSDEAFSQEKYAPGTLAAV
jgi:hypothetical protein